MAITQSQTNAGAVQNFASGKYLDDGTAAAFSIACGFKPRFVKVWNVAATGGSLEHVEGMAAASAQKFLTNAAAFAQGSLIASNGITLNDNGFTVGLDTDINVSNEQLYWIAFG